MEKNADAIMTTDPKFGCSTSSAMSGHKTTNHVTLPSMLFGNIYKLKLYMYLMKRAIESDMEFCIDVKLNEIHGIDDLLFLYKETNQNKIVIVQVKHKYESDAKIKHTALTSESVDGGNFYLPKYFEIFNRIKASDSFREYESKQLVVITNGNFEMISHARHDTSDWNKYCTCRKLSSNCDYEQFLCINREAQRCNFSDIFRKDKFQNIGNQCSGHKNDSAEEFFHNFSIITNYPSENEIDKLIGNKLVEKFNVFRNEMLWNFFEKEMINFFMIKNKRMRKSFYSQSDGFQFYKALETNLDTLIGYGISIPCVQMLRSHRIEFTETENFRKQKESYLKYLILPCSSILHIRTECAVLSAIKILQAFNILKEINYQQKINGYLFMDIKTIENQYELVKNGFLLNQSNHLLVIVAEKEFSIDVMELCMNLLPNSEENDNSMSKKIILISQGHDIDTKEIIDKNINFQDLSGKSQLELLKTEVRFQGKRVPLNQLLSQTLAREIIDIEHILKLMKNETIEIGRKNTFSSFGFIEDFYINRELRNPADEKILSENDVILLNQKVFLIVDDSGQGKSTLLTSLSKKLKDRSTLWLVRLNLNELPQNGATISLNEIDFSEYNAYEALKFISKFAVSEYPSIIEESIFKQSKIAIFVDGFDEISSEHQDKTITLLKALNKNANITLWVTSTMRQSDKLEQALGTIAFQLHPLMKENKIEFLSNYLQWNYGHCLVGNEIFEKCSEKKMEYLMQLKKAVGNDDSTNKHLNLPPNTIENNLSFKTLNIREYAECSLRKRRDSLRDSEGDDFVLNLLHLRMLAEIIVVKAIELPSNFGEFNLYSVFVDSKLETLNEKCSLDLDNGQYESFKQMAVKVILSEKAFEIFFPTESLRKSDDIGKILTFMGNENSHETLLESVGLLNKDQSAFIHHSIAEYFASRYLFKNLKIENIGNVILKHLQDRRFTRIYKFFINSIQQNYSVSVKPIPLNRIILVELFAVPEIRTNIYQFRSIYTAYEWYIDQYFFQHSDKTNAIFFKMNNLLENIAVKMFFPVEITELLPLPELANDDVDAIFEDLFECEVLSVNENQIDFVDRTIAEYFLCRYLCKYFKNSQVQHLLINKILHGENFILVRRLFFECLLLFTGQFRGIIEWIIISSKEYTKDLVIPENTRKLIDFIENHNDERRYIPQLFKEFRKIYQQIDEEVAIALFGRVTDQNNPLYVQMRAFDNIEHLYMVKNSEHFDNWKSRSFKSHSEFTIMSLALSRKPVQTSQRDITCLFEERLPINFEMNLGEMYYVCVPPPQCEGPEKSTWV